MTNTAPLSGWTPPPSVEEYRLLQLLGRGVSGLVYLAQDTLLERLVALKFILAIDADAVGRFLVEARATARLQHPNVLTLYRVGQLDERPFLVSEFVRGASLAQTERPMPWRDALQLALGITRGLAAAHRRGVLHRDIKPGNVMISSAGEVKLLDFGLAKLDKSPAIASPAWPLEAPTLALPDITGHGAYIGTPYYMAPELWRREPATRRSDVYSLGALLYELCSGRAPLRDVAPAELPAAAQTRTPPPCASFQGESDATFAGFAALIDRCLEREPERRYASAEEVLDGLEQLSRPAAPALPPAGNPYRGLQAFDGEHRALFFGRASEIRAVVERLRSEAFVLVIGDSGVGKSSLAAAGVLPVLAEGALDDGRSWSTLRLKPGRDPLGTLAALLAPLVGENEELLARALRAEPLALSRQLRRRLGTARGLVLLVDQLEELVTVAPAGEAEAFARVLRELAGGILGTRVVATMRSDFLMRLAALGELGDCVARALYLLRPLSESGLCAAIVEPARATGISFEPPSLIDTLVKSTLRTAGGLPLLQFTLAQLWEARDRDGTISPQTLARIGGLEGALARHADEVLAGMLPDERAAARRILLRLVTVENTRAVRLRAELAVTPAAAGALDALVRGRLVVVHDDGERGATYEVAHEALIAGWGTLNQWLADELDQRAARQRLETAAREWERLRRADEALWGKKHRAQVELIDREQLAPLEAAFLDASQAAWRRARRGRLAMAIGAPLVLVALYGAFAAQARLRTQAQVERYLLQAAAARSSAEQRSAALAALEQRAFDAFDAADLAAGERAHGEALALAGKIEDDYTGAAEALERALALDGGQRAVRHANAELIAERARFDEANRKPVSERATVARIALYDEAVAARFVAPVQLRVETTPAAAEVRIYRYDRDRGYRLEPVGGGAASRAQALLPGSYLVEAAAAGRATVRESVLLARGSDQVVQLALPPAAVVPAGFAYVPAGSFLFGAAGDESMRREFYRTVPLHPRHTPAFLIARHETTYADWIAFLEALPPEERGKRLPRVAARGFHGSVALERTAADGWHLRFQVTTREYQAAATEPIVYDTRTTARTQRWQRFPVSGIAWDDVLAYTRWLSSSGRLPGARPCREDEWERAVRGADGRAFPHGDQLRPGDANWEATYDKQPLAFGPDEVGLHPASNSPFGLADAAGNVWEWTESVLKRGELVARGGSLYFPTPSARSANREPIEPTLRDLTIGVRVCADPVAP